MKLILLIMSAIGCSGPKASAQLRLDPLLTDHMVLQREIPVRISGAAEPGERIQVSIDGQNLSTKATKDGRWAVMLAPMEAGGPFTLQIKGKTTLMLRDVLIGEVWLASGQSNMNYPLSGAEHGEDDLQRADLSEVRLVSIPKETTLEPQRISSAQWSRCTPATARSFSAVAYYFARDLNHRLGIPVGIIQSTWSGSQGEEWTSYRTLQESPELQPIVKQWRSLPAMVRHFDHVGADLDLQFENFELLPNDRLTPLVNFSSFEHRFASTAWSGHWEADGSSSFSLVKSDSNHSAYLLNFSGHLSPELTPELRAIRNSVRLGKVVSFDFSAFQAIRFHVRGNGCLHTHFEEPETADGDFFSSNVFCASSDWKTVTLPFREYHQDGWGIVSHLHLDQIQEFVIDADPTNQRYVQRSPGGLYNGMISPIVNFTIRGVLWYQGEGNAGRAYQYRTLLPKLISDWRNAYKEGDLPFLIVQLPNFGTPSLDAENSDWAELREAQALTVEKTPGTGLVVTIDLGEAGNLHPPRKAEVGNRLADLALGKIYSVPIEFTGPVLQRIESKGSTFHLQFSHAPGLTTSNLKAVEGFAIAGEDKQFGPATAIISGTTITVSSPSVSHPVAVRYAWASNPICNVVNGAALPLGPFRTDYWPEVTEASR